MCFSTSKAKLIVEYLSMNLILQELWELWLQFHQILVQGETTSRFPDVSVRPEVILKLLRTSFGILS